MVTEVGISAITRGAPEMAVSASASVAIRVDVPPHHSRFVDAYILFYILLFFIFIFFLPVR